MKNYLSGELIGPQTWAVTIGNKKAVVRKRGRRWEYFPFAGPLDWLTHTERDKRQFITVVKKCA